jgi:glucose-6-phosphate 1-epimerase
MNIESLNQQFSIKNHLHFHADNNEFTFITLRHDQGEVIVSLYGAQVIGYQPKGENPIIWLSEDSFFQTGKAIRGGVPLCWPWFSDHSTDPTQPAHGFLRTSLWTVTKTTLLDSKEVQLSLSLTSSANTQQYWDHDFQVECLVTLGKQLRIELVITNTDTKPFSFSGALHSYFCVNDIHNTQIQGLENHYYSDKTKAYTITKQHNNIHFSEEVDRIYQQAPATCTINDTLSQRLIHVERQGGDETVIWNPWKEKAKAMKDFNSEGYQHMVCVESAIAGDSSVTLAPNHFHTLSTTIHHETV